MFFHRRPTVSGNGSFMQLEGYLARYPHHLQLQPPGVDAHYITPWRNDNTRVVKSYQASVFLIFILLLSLQLH